MKKAIFTMVVVGAFSATAVAGVSEPDVDAEQGQVRITYSPEMVSTAEGRETLERKIRQAAAKVCGPQDLRRAGSFSRMSANRNCYRKAVADAMNTIKPSGIAITD
ncbi:MAG: UrcA family protein [Gammaproteobacteria bacterium]|jgi:UrcA family protein